jgi:hypothetical protein
MKTISGSDHATLTPRNVSMLSWRGHVLFGVIAWTIFLMPVVVIAKDKDPDHDRDDRRHSLLTQVHVKADISALQSQVTDLKTQVAALTSTITALQNSFNTLASTVANSSGGSGTSVLNALAKYVTVDTTQINGLNGPHVIFTGVNVHVRSGSGATGDNGTTLGLGNLVVGYNAPPVNGGGLRTGSHNLVGGDGNSFSSYGGFVFGSQNSTNGPYTTISGGEANVAQGFASSILGGRSNFVGSGDQTSP